MPLKLRIIEIVECHRVVDAGAASEHTEETFHVWVEEPKPRRFKVNLAKASAQDLQTILGNVGAVLLMDVGEMVQQNAHALYLKPNYDIDVLIPAPVLQSADHAKPEIKIQPVTDSKPEKIEPVTEKTDIKEPVPVGSNAGGNRPAQPTR
ncbi:MAG: hypothetical protein RIQ94_3055 [Pseudomonadota bacterium]